MSDCGGRCAPAGLDQWSRSGSIGSGCVTSGDTGGSAVSVGDEVVLGAGIVGRVAGGTDEFLELEISPGVLMKVARGAVVRVILPEDAGNLDDVDETSEPGEHDDLADGSHHADLPDPPTRPGPTEP